MRLPIFLSLVFLACSLQAQEASRKIKINKKYLNLPVQHSEDRQMMSFEMDGDMEREFVIRLSEGEPDYWVFADMSAHQGKTLTINYPKKAKGLKSIYLADKWAGQDSVYNEVNRPQFHFTSQRGWNNDPNGLVYYQGEYHLYYQHNPYEANWENMHWGHAVSKDLLHWEELGDALYPDKLGTMFSGTATIDFNNTSGWQMGEEPPLVAFYTAHKNHGNGDATQTQCVAYSNDRGRTFTKYEGNPIIDSKQTWNSRHTRDPKVFWHEESNKWVMVLFEKDGHSFYNSDDMKNWTYLSHIGGFWECPELFELPIDGNKYNTKWVIYGASGTYMIGDFDGREFKPLSGKHTYVAGGLYAAQTYNNIPEEDGRRIQFGWGQIPHRDMPFKHMMLFPTELTLKSTRNGIRMYSKPIAEVSELHKKSYNWGAISHEDANEKFNSVDSDLLHIKAKVQIIDGTSFALQWHGNPIVHYTMNHNKLNGNFYENGDTESGMIELEILLDKTSVEIYADGGAFNIIQPLDVPKTDTGLAFAGFRSEIKIHHLEVHEMKSIWNK